MAEPGQEGGDSIHLALDAADELSRAMKGVIDAAKR